MTEDPIAADSKRATSTASTRWIRLAISIGVLAVFAFVGRRHFGELHRLAEVSIGPVVLMFGCVLLGRIGQARTLQLLLAALEHVVELTEAFSLSNLTSYSNLFVPRSGVGAAAFYLNRRHRVPYSSYGSITVFLAVIDAVATGLVGGVSLVLASAITGTPFDARIAFAFGVVVVAGILTMRVRLRLPSVFGDRLGSFLRSLSDAWRRLGHKGSVTARILSLRLGLLVLAALRLQLAFMALGVDVGFIGVLLAAMLGTLAQLSSITPAGIGIREAAIAFGATAIGCSPATALTAAILDRLVMTVFLVVAGQIGLWRSIGEPVPGADQAGPPRSRR